MPILDEYGRVKLDNKSQKYLLTTFQKYLKYHYKNLYDNAMEEKHFKKTTDLFNQIPKDPGDLSKGYYPDLNDSNVPAQSELSRFKNSKLKKGKNSIFPTKKVSTFLEDKLNVTTSSAKDYALPLTTYAYEFFFISLPKYEIFNEFPDTLNENPDIRNLFPGKFYDKDHLFDSFIKLKLGFSMLYAPISMGMYSTYSGQIGALDGKEKYLTQKSFFEWQRIFFSEGFLPYRFSSMYLEKLPKIGRKKILTNSEFSDYYPVLSNMFTALFADIAAELLDKKEYDFTNINRNSKYKTVESKGLLAFYLRDFMPLVLKKIQNLLTSENKVAISLQIYSDLTTLHTNDFICPFSDNTIRYNYKGLTKIKEFTDTYHFRLQEWFTWYQDIFDNSEYWNKWLKLQNNHTNGYDFQKDILTVTKLKKMFDFSEYGL
ncbi:hypothetical protein JCM15457_1772 [Liquorilactobacillus sucicola DSM 21376 = JCM 15457]|uniref:Uncharacterized protein n=1 Tax=Liquorilactobacillus sucicola DSM 21376 = JCM 15457 TaxID=1423806 RepID=A0A023CY65_9LACO|nr:hypothetical protein [Liquorilactobacillus sucicola]KRN07549.1 hypothetical protein FD15_GL000834 [Liquorilactobacillus sucicola DSM 21376 = JCM 15457]GAJ26822.1 hypothetical protein JCM15457_1772 [Liquorilactobacillus sucicola DSM 21376 = JCM 15457]